MDFDTVRKKARADLKGYCRVCPACDGRACSGEVPGMGGIGSGSSFRANIESLAAHQFQMSAVHAVKEPDTSLKLWGRHLSIPLMAAPMTGTTYNMGGSLSEADFAERIIEGALEAGSLGFIGDGADPLMYESGLRAIKKSNGHGVAIIKPRSQKEIISRIKMAEEAGALAVGVDIDGAGLVTMALKGQAVGPKTGDEIASLVESTELPFILKGVMSREDALTAHDAGVAAIVVSNHGGRVLDFTPGAADVLPKISSAVKGKMLVFADGGVRWGADILKYLALGADAVLTGRPLIIGAFGGEVEGVSMIINQMKQELFQAMLLTGTADVQKVLPEILRPG
ncbi:alpha-hydroxy-acid oxidizing protein [Desulfonatronovibrio hydrogenovorans]|uniref:alpha-hydroxy-acid oxidizing protein n=1 Tax=Desulfonatronovibrio hydrogenovorans TaxID=53245 RepID=UPI00048AD2BF|nr:alpha-hydroxy-acid oxidizing protein [Desulfonatronovibrio hydrogenovorans]